MRIIEGQCGCEGVARGPVFVVDKQDIQVSNAASSNPGDEIRRFWTAKEKAKEQISELLHNSNKLSSSIGSSIFSAYIVYLDDARFKKDIESLIINDNYSAKQAIEAVGKKYADFVASMEDNPRMQARKSDVIEITERLLLCLEGEEMSVPAPKVPSIIVAKELTPSYFFSVDRDNVLGYVLEHGAYNSHFAILARSFDIPLLMNVPDVTSQAVDGVDCALHATRDTFVIEPTEDELDLIRQAIEEDRAEKERLEVFKGKDTMTYGGERIILYANVSSLEEIDIAMKNDTEGIGLFRTEYIFLDSKTYPTEEEQFNIYREAVRKVDGKIIVFRTADIGADKLPSYIETSPVMNSHLGIRGIRFCMANRAMFKTQLRALFRAAYYGTGNVNVMYPMISKLEEMDWIDDVRAEVISELDHEQVNYKIPEHGIVIETPAAALSADVFAPRVDFFSIGTNDLSQLLFAVDRTEQNIDVEDFKGVAIRRVMKYIIETGERAGIPVGLCGDISSDKQTLKWIIDAGIKGLSVQPRQILLFRKYIREM